MSAADETIPVRGVWTDENGTTWARFDVSADISQANPSDRPQLASDLRSHLMESAARFVDGWVAITRGDSPEAVTAAINRRPSGLVDCGDCRTQGCQGTCRRVVVPARMGACHPSDDGEGA